MSSWKGQVLSHPLSILVANLFVENFEAKALSTAANPKVFG